MLVKSQHLQWRIVPLLKQLLQGKQNLHLLSYKTLNPHLNKRQGKMRFEQNHRIKNLNIRLRQT